MGGYLIAAHLNRRASVSLERVDAWMSLLTHIKNEIECFSMPVGEILRKTDMSILEGCGYGGAKPPKDMSELILRSDFSDEECKKIVSNFTSEFGRCYRDEQVRRCEYYISRLDGVRTKISEQLPSKRKLNLTLCIAGSLAIAIIFC